MFLFFFYFLFYNILKWGKIVNNLKDKKLWIFKLEQGNF